MKDTVYLCCWLDGQNSTQPKPSLENVRWQVMNLPIYIDGKVNNAKNMMSILWTRCFNIFPIAGLSFFICTLIQRIFFFLKRSIYFSNLHPVIDFHSLFLYHFNSYSTFSANEVLTAQILFLI